MLTSCLALGNLKIPTFYNQFHKSSLFKRNNYSQYFTINKRKLSTINFKFN